MLALSVFLKRFSVALALLGGSLSLALASVPPAGVVTDDTAIYQNLSEIRVMKQADLSFDGDLKQLTQLEGRYQEKLPARARLEGASSRISHQKYRSRAKRVSAPEASGSGN